jgi:hypothetical protein
MKAFYPDEKKLKQLLFNLVNPQVKKENFSFKIDSKSSLLHATICNQNCITYFFFFGDLNCILILDEGTEDYCRYHTTACQPTSALHFQI